MGVRLKLGAWLVANHRRGFGNLFTDTLEHAPLNAGFGAGRPGQVGVVNHDPLREISVKVHGFYILPSQALSKSQAPTPKHSEND
jgi:hypothetical protein